MRGGGNSDTMKYSTLAILFALFSLTGCGLDKKINDATAKCETIVSEALEGLENTCLTKEEILELISHLNLDEHNTQDVCSGGVTDVE